MPKSVKGLGCYPTTLISLTNALREHKITGSEHNKPHQHLQICIIFHCSYVPWDSAEEPIWRLVHAMGSIKRKETWSKGTLIFIIGSMCACSLIQRETLRTIPFTNILENRIQNKVLQVLLVRKCAEGSMKKCFPVSLLGFLIGLLSIIMGPDLPFYHVNTLLVDLSLYILFL